MEFLQSLNSLWRNSVVENPPFRGTAGQMCVFSLTSTLRIERTSAPLEPITIAEGGSCLGRCGWTKWTIHRSYSSTNGRPVLERRGDVQMLGRGVKRKSSMRLRASVSLTPGKGRESWSNQLWWCRLRPPDDAECFLSRVEIVSIAYRFDTWITFCPVDH